MAFKSFSYSLRQGNNCLRISSQHLHKLLGPDTRASTRSLFSLLVLVSSLTRLTVELLFFSLLDYLPISILISTLYSSHGSFAFDSSSFTTHYSCRGRALSFPLAQWSELLGRIRSAQRCIESTCMRRVLVRSHELPDEERAREFDVAELKITSLHGTSDHGLEVGRLDVRVLGEDLEVSVS